MGVVFNNELGNGKPIAPTNGEVIMPSRFQILTQERADLVREARATLTAAGAANRELTAEEMTRDDAINARLSAINTELEREERLRAYEREVAPAAAATNLAAGIQVRDRIEDDPMRGFANAADFGRAVHAASRPSSAFIDDRLRFGAAPTSYHQETGTSEGYMVPPAMRDAIWANVYGDESLLSMVDHEPTSSNSVELITDESTPWGSTGIQANWRSEGSQMSPSKLATNADSVKLHELYAFALSTEELLQDAPRLNNRLTTKAGEAIRYKINEAFVNGTGAGQPLGWMNSAAKVTQAKEGSQVAATVVAANVAKMYARVINPNRAEWLINQDVFPQLLTMTLSNQPIWTPPASGFSNAPGGILLGRPVRILENCATVGTEGDIQLVNGDGYYAASRDSAPQFASSMHLYFDYNMQAFRWTFRLAGQPFMSAPISPAKGSTTRSHFVTLAVRS